MVDAPPARRRAPTVALVVSFVSLALALVSCGLVGLVLVTSDVDLLPVQSKPVAASAAQVEAVAHVTLPPGTVLLAAAYSNGLETLLSATFRIPTAGRESFLDSGRFTADLTPGLRPLDATHNVGGGNLWHPEAATSVSGLAEQEPGPDGTYRSLMFDLDAPDAITVYLYALRP